VRVRWAIERGYGNDPEGRVYLSLLDREGDPVGGQENTPYDSEAAAQADALQSAQNAGRDSLTWKPAPEGWQPDTYLVSNYYDDEEWSDR